MLTSDQKIVISKLAKERNRDRSGERAKSPAVIPHSLSPGPQNFIAPATKIVTSDLVTHEHPAAAKLHRLSAQSREKLSRSMAPREENSPPTSSDKRRSAEERSPKRDENRGRSKSPTAEELYEAKHNHHLPGSKVPSRASRENPAIFEAPPVKSVQSRPISKISDSYEAVPAASERFNLRNSREYAKGRS